MDNYSFTFSGNSAEALAMLWLRKQDISGKSPAEMYGMYTAAVKEIQACITNASTEEWL